MMGDEVDDLSWNGGGWETLRTDRRWEQRAMRGAVIGGRRLILVGDEDAEVQC